jgi:hypothetical protein
MKKLVVLSICVVSTNFLNAQTFNEWFKQKETQIKYLLEQIAALRAYGEVINKGYDIAHSGLTAIFNSKDGDFKQHSDYFLSLWMVKTSIKSYSKVVSILRMETEIEKTNRAMNSFVTELLNAKERNYIKAVYSNLFNECVGLVGELKMVVSDNQLQLKDDERIERVDKIYLQMLDRYQFSNYFSNGIKLLVLNQLKEKNEINKLSTLYSLK